MEKKLSQAIYDELKKVPEGQVAIPYLTPTDKDNFREEGLGDDLYRVALDDSYAVVAVKNKDKNISVKFLDSKIQDDYHLAKLQGYIMIKIAARYVK